MQTHNLETLLAAAEPLIKLAIAEDIGPGDATSQSTLAADTILHGRIRAKSLGVIAGLPVAKEVFRQVDPRIRFTAQVADGQEVVPGELLAEVTGPGPSLLAAERLALNFLQRMSGVATLTSSTWAQWVPPKRSSWTPARPCLAIASWTNTRCAWAAGSITACRFSI